MKFTLNFLNCLLLGVIAFLSCARTTRSVGHDSNIGICQDVIWNRSAPLMTKVVHKNNNRMFKMFRKIELTLRFPENGDFPAPIKCMMFKDNARDGNGAFTTIKSGGVGYRHVYIYFRSQRGGDINFDVGIYADPSHVGGGMIQPQYSPPPTYPIAQPPYHGAQPAYTAQQMGWNNQPPPPHGWNYPPPNHTYYGR